MSYQPIFRGAQPNDNTGDNLREGARKINANFTEIYAALGTGSTITYNMNSFVLNDVSNVTVPMPLHEQVLSWDNNTSTWIAVDKLSGNVVGHMIPTSNNTYDLGDPTHEFRDIFLSGNAVFSPDSQRLFSDNGVLSVQYDYQTSNAILLDTDDSTASSATSQDIYFSNTSVMDSVTVGGTTIYLFPGIDLSSSAPYALLQNINVELTLSNSSFSNTYTNYDESTYGTAIGTHADSFYFSGPTSVTVKNGQLAPANTAQSPLQIEQDLLDADTAQLVIKRISSDGTGEVIVSNRTQTITNKTIPAANNSILMSIGDLFDVDVPTANAGDNLTWSDTANAWVAQQPGSHLISGTIVDGHLLPTANAAYDLGSPTNQFKDLYMTGNSIHLGSTTISSSGGKISFGGATLSAPLEINDHVIPDQNEAYDLGSATNKFRDLYLSSSTINLGTASLSVGPDGLTYTEKAPVVLYKDTIQQLNPNFNSQYNLYKPNQLTTLTASDAASNDNFGYSVAMTNSRIVVGSPYKTYAPSSLSQAGSAYVFDITGNELSKLVPNDVESFDHFGWSVGVSDTVIVVGSPSEDDSSSDAGSAYIFNLDGTSQLAKIQASDAAQHAAQNFGWSVAASSTRVVVGAPRTDDVDINSGAAYIFDTQGNQLTKLLPDDILVNDRFGSSVAISDTRIAVGAPGVNSSVLNSGAVYVYDINGTQLAKLTPQKIAGTTSLLGSEFGVTVAISDTRIVVGAAGINTTASSTGVAYVYDIDGNFITQLTAYDAEQNDYFGSGVAVYNDKIIVSAPGEDEAGTSAGAVYVFDTDGNPLGKVIANDLIPVSFSGTAVAISNSKFLSASFNRDSGVGGVYTFDVNSSSNSQPQLFGINGLDDFGKTYLWPEKVVVNNHIIFSPETSFTAKLNLHSVTGEVVHTFDLLQEGAGDWSDDPANGFINVNTQNKGFIVDKLGKFWIKYPTDLVGFEILMQNVSFATFSILNIQNATPPQPVKPVDNPAGISASNVPANSSATGTKGDIVVGANYVYICKDTDSWVRVAIDTGW